MQFFRGAISCTLLGGVIAGVSAAQDDHNWLVLDTGGPIGAVRALGFSPDSSRLYAAGSDKCVHVWTLHDPATGRPNLKHLDCLRWEIGRATRGIIYAMDVASDGRVAIAGESALQIAGDIVVVDPARKQFAALLPPQRPDEIENAPLGHRRPVVSLSFSPDGKHLASVSIDGELRVWTFDETRVSCRVLRSAQEGRDRQRQPAVFLNSQYLAAAWAANDSEHWHIRLIDVTTEKLFRTVPRLHQKSVMTIARDPYRPGRWASADETGAVFIWNTLTAQTPVMIRSDRALFCMSFARPDRLLLSTAYSKRSELPALLELWEIGPNRQTRLSRVELGSSDYGYSCALSPNGRYAVAYANMTHDLWLYDLDQGPRAGAVDPLRPDGGVRLFGRGRTIQHVAFADDAEQPYRLGIRQEGGRPFGFDLTGPALLTDTQTGLLPDGGSPGSWRLQGKVGDRQLQFTGPGQPAARCRIQLSPVQGYVSAFTWLPNGTGEPGAVAVACAPNNEVYIYRLVAQGDCPLLRSFRDHGDRVDSLSCSRDGKYLASAARDQTIKIWNLDRLLEHNATFSQATAWGAVFVQTDGRAVVQSVWEGGTTDRRGIEQGDVIAGLKHYDKNNRIVMETDAKAILAALRDHPLWAECELHVERAGKPLDHPVPIVPGWAPLLTLFVDRHGEWALWNPKGYYDASAQGDELFGWLKNEGRTAPPAFFRGAHFRRELEQPEVIRHLLSEGSLSAALPRARVAVPNPKADAAALAVAGAPVVRVIEPTEKQTFADRSAIDVVAEVVFADDDGPTDHRVRAFVNQIPGGAAEGTPSGPNTFRYRWRIRPPDSLSTVRVQVVDASDAVRHEDRAVIHVPAPTKPLRLHLLALGASAYPGIMQLPYARKDAEDFSRLIRERSGQLYELVPSKPLVDGQITHEAVRSQYEALKKAGLDDGDLLVVYVAGHGKFLNHEYYFLLPTIEKPTQHKLKDPLFMEKNGLSWTTMRQFVDLPCRKAFFVDTCAAGGISSLEEGYKGMVRPLSDAMAMVFCATGTHLQAAYPGNANGLFTECLMAAIRGSADGSVEPKKDGEVDLRETVAYVKNRVAKRTANVQTPRLYREGELLDFMQRPLFLAEREPASEVADRPTGGE